MQKALMLVLAGVAIGLLVAPEKGAATQRKISNWLSGKASDAEDFLGDAASTARSKARSLKNDLQDVKNEVKTKQVISKEVGAKTNSGKIS